MKLNLNYQLYESPFPHLIIQDFIQDVELVDFLANNQDLPRLFNQIDYDNLERIDIYGSFKEKKVSGKYTFCCPVPNASTYFNTNISTFLNDLKHHSDFNKTLKEVFTPIFEKEYVNYTESFTDISLAYGAYNRSNVAKNLIGWHLDRGDKLLAGFLYFREEGDTSDDGHLFFSDGSPMQKELTYKNNVLVVWPNLTRAWHKAGVRYPTNHFRRFVKIVYKSDGKVYHDYQTTKKYYTVNKNELYQNKEFGFKRVNLL